MTNLTVHVVLDRSGSMEVVRGKTIKAFNDYAALLAKDNPGSRLSLTVFGGADLDTVIDDEDAANVTPLDKASYQPNGGTPLYDAIGHVIGLLDNANGQHKAMVILTDGEENQSSKFSKDDIRRMLSERQEEENWLVLYLGANQDAFAEGAKFGSRAGTTMTYNTANMAETMASAAAATTRYAVSGSLRSAEFTADERKAARVASAVQRRPK